MDSNEMLWMEPKENVPKHVLLGIPLNVAWVTKTIQKIYFIKLVFFNIDTDTHVGLQHLGTAT